MRPVGSVERAGFVPDVLCLRRLSDAEYGARDLVVALDEHRPAHVPNFDPTVQADRAAAAEMHAGLDLRHQVHDEPRIRDGSAPWRIIFVPRHRLGGDGEAPFDIRATKTSLYRSQFRAGLDLAQDAQLALLARLASLRAIIDSSAGAPIDAVPSSTSVPSSRSIRTGT